ncbi:MULTISPECIES: MlaC/ttg2D family ABC transporter substrate-binding protein [Vitreoscilla]|uniref:ABC transporter substrate-binding protein n=1 Tax=Vitreoscilla stercoraria TaxID=61 RepID=A0ABY4EC67_VITST|nr:MULTISPECIES: ABC transporter substrate-binding protein [Vitreoscilla]QJQ52433.1 toluene tolerance protein Ttg2 [Vitreoscilla sp. C1]UOO92505.1 ABC transporter substrate-binding protein [Vitreoscilla stercoraria]
MKKMAILNALAVGVLSIGMAMATPQQAVTQLRGNADKVLNILDKANGNNNAQVRREAENYAIPYFDFDRMTALAVGAPWRTASAAQKKALSNEFKTLLIRTYSGTMLKFKGAQIQVNGNPVVNNGGKEVVVKTSVTASSQGKPVKMDYTMYQSGNQYRVYNVSVEGASLVTVYRNQFNETIRKSGIDGLIAELKKKNG